MLPTSITLKTLTGIRPTSTAGSEDPLFRVEFEAKEDSGAVLKLKAVPARRNML